MIKKICILVRKRLVFEQTARALKDYIESKKNVLVEIKHVKTKKIMQAFDNIDKTDTILIFFSDVILDIVGKYSNRINDISQYKYIIYMFDEWFNKRIEHNSIQRDGNTLITNSLMTWFFDDSVMERFICTHKYTQKNILCVPFVYSPLFEIQSEKNIAYESDVLFYGSETDRRKKHLPYINDYLTNKGYKVTILIGIDKDIVYKYLANTKIVLIVLAADFKPFDIHRVAPLLLNKKFIVAEKSTNVKMDEKMSKYMCIDTIDKLGERCDYYLNNFNETFEMVNNGYTYCKEEFDKNYLDDLF